jgi:hypothetical protein
VAEKSTIDKMKQNVESFDRDHLIAAFGSQLSHLPWSSQIRVNVRKSKKDIPV